MTRFTGLVLTALILFSPTVGAAGPTEDANAVIDHWSAAYTANDPDTIVKNYWPDAILLGTVSPVISIGTDAISKYFSAVKGTGNKNAIGERHAIVIGEDAVLLTGFYEFTGIADGKVVPRPSRFTMLITRRAGEWRIAHHHSSPHVQPKQ
ncbi:MAG TPA: SgcJ/EcaC family oxidoreductase [Methylomirabilota bacterium]|nr:SgcJ/EcaC family oxidoreductase [Methylomirabilota bacterium]